MRAGAGRSRTSGLSAASSTVVAVRSYSRNVPTTSLEIDTCIPGACRSSSRASRRSCSGWAYECSSATATASGRAPATRSMSARAGSGSSVTSGPSGPQRSGAANRSSSPTRGAGAASHSRYRCARAWRPSSITSVNPAVAISAVRAPRPCSSAFVATVMPCANPVTSPGSAPARASTAPTAASTPRASSAGVVGTLTECMTPSSPTSTASVNVPPTSTPRIITQIVRGTGRPAPTALFRGPPARMRPKVQPDQAAASSRSSVSARCWCEGQ